jgi:chaperonin GroEL
MAIVKKVHFGESGRKKLINGVDTLANAVKSTLGAKGRTVLIESENHTHGVVATKDGITVASSINLIDSVENLAVNVVREASRNTASTAGDGTTTAIVLTQALIHAATKQETNDMTGMIREIQEAAKYVDSELKKRAIPVTGETMYHVATVSANNDAEIGKLIADAYSQVNYVSVQDSKDHTTYSEIVEGMKVDRGYSSRFFVTDQKRNECVLELPYVLVADQTINNLSSIEQILAPIVKAGKSLLIIAELGQNALNTLNVNVLKGTIKVCNVAPPDFGYRRKDIMEDIAAMVGARLLSEDTGDDLTLASMADLGQCERVVVGQDSTILIGGAGDEMKIEDRVKALEGSKDEFEQRRAANMTGGVGVIFVGATSEIEQKEKKDRVDDAVCAVRAALEEGILPGGGVTLLNISYDLTGAKNGSQVLAEAMRAPFMQIMGNAGLDGAKIATKVKNGDGGVGYDVKNDLVGDMIEMGITDPAKVTRTALANAVSVATTILQTDVIISNVREGDQ